MALDSNESKLAILVLSCDKYSDLWDDFFNLKERFWPDCPYSCYLATDTKEYQRNGVEVIHFGNIRTWTICAREAISHIKEPYVALFLEDAFIYKTIDSSIVAENLQFCIDHKVDYLTMERNCMERKLTKEDHVAQHIWRIYRHRRYGINTSAAIWDKLFLQKALEKEDCSAWEFEVIYCREADTPEGLQGEIFFDDRQPFNISPIEIVRLGKISPDAVKFYKKLGYSIDTTKRPLLSKREQFVFKAKFNLERIPYLSKVIKSISKVFGFEYFS